nr:MAK10-like protein [Tanacetum cinerariifolium]
MPKIGDENPFRTLGDYSKPSHEGYRNTIELPIGNNVVSLRSDTIRERTRLRLFQFSLRDQASNWLECLPARSISTWEDLTTRFLAQLFSPGRTAKLRNNILMFQQHHGESLSEAWTRFKDLLQKFPHHSAGGKLRDINPEESWAILEDLALYDNESWNDPRDFAKLVKAIALPQDVPSTSDRHLIELENQVQCLMEAHLTPTQPTQVHKITTPCEICSGPHDTQNCIENPEQAFVEYASSRTDEAGVSPLPKSYRDVLNDLNWHGMDTAYLLLYIDDIVLTPSSETSLRQIIASLHQEFSMKDLVSPLPKSYRDVLNDLNWHGMDTAYLLLYIDDIVLTPSFETSLRQIIASLHQEFSMKDFGSLNYFFGIFVLRDSSRMFLSQKKYAVEILKKAHMVNCNLVGLLLILSLNWAVMVMWFLIPLYIRVLQ